jgi:hypothetical protein
MATTPLLLAVVGLVIGASVGYAVLSSRDFDRRHPEAKR